MVFNNGRPFTTTQAYQLGVKDGELRQRLRCGELRRVVHGVFVDATVGDSRALRAQALAVVVPDSATVALHTAAWLYGADTFPPGGLRDLTPYLIVPHGSARPVRERATTFQTVLPDSEAVEIEGVRVTSPVRTATDLLRIIRRPYALAAADAMVRAGLVEVLAVQEAVRGIRRLRGTQQAKELAPRIDPGSETHGESWMKCRILDAGLPMPELQHVVCLDGVARRLDGAYVSQRVATEYDGREFHLGVWNEANDDDRRSGLRLRKGWRFVIATRENLFGDDESFERQVGELLGIRVLPRRWR